MVNPLGTPFKTLCELWRMAYRGRDHTRLWTTVNGIADGPSQNYSIPNLGDDIVAVVLHLSIRIDASDVANAVANAVLSDLLDNVYINAPDGKSVHNIDKSAMVNFVAEFLDKNFTQDALTNFAKAGNTTFTAKIPLPVFIPASHGIHTIQFDFSLSNIYPTATTTINAASYIRLEVVTKANSGLEKFRCVSQAIAVPAGPFTLTTLETGRIWYALGIEGGLAAVTDFDDVRVGVDKEELVNTKYPNLVAEFRDSIPWTPRFTTDGHIYFAPHIHKNTDDLTIQGLVAKTPAIMLICSADEVNMPATATPSATVTVAGLNVANSAQVQQAIAGGAIRINPGGAAFQPQGMPGAMPGYSTPSPVRLNPFSGIQSQPLRY